MRHVTSHVNTNTALMGWLSDLAFIRAESQEVRRGEHDSQHGGRLVYVTAHSFVAGGPEPQEGGGLGQAQTVMV